MPQISKNNVEIYHEDIRKYYTITVMYNKDEHFYAIVPGEFHDIVHHLSKEEMDEMGISKKHKRRFEAEYQPIVSTETEHDCLQGMTKAIKKLTGKAIEQRDVIIVFYNADFTSRYNSHEHNAEHPQIGMQYGLTYAVETSVGDKKVYSLYSKLDWFGEEKTTRYEIDLYNKASTIIPDTEENRKMLEQLYSNFKELNKRLTEFTSTPETMLELISNGVKMLNS